MLLQEVAQASAEIAGTASRSAKTRRVAAALQAAATEELPVVLAWLSGELRQGRIGVGWSAFRCPPQPAPAPTLEVLGVDAELSRCLQMAGPGSRRAREELVASLLCRATAVEQRLLADLVTGELHQGAARGVLLDAVAVAAGVPPAQVRAAVALAGDVLEVACAALDAEPGDRARVLAGFGLRVGRPLAPMLAQSAPDVAGALARTGPAAVEWKLDGVRVQIHRNGRDVRIWTRSLDEVTARLPEVAARIRELRCTTAVLDGEVIALRRDGRPGPFQATAARAASADPGSAAGLPLSTVLFDVLHLDGTDLVGQGTRARRAVLERLGGQDLLVPRLELPGTGGVLDETDVAAAEDFAADALARGHEGVVVKALDAGYAMGRRGAGWVKVKPRITLDLVVLAAEWGHGRRTGRLSNLHLGARDPQGRFGPAGGFVMLGKTFKGLTDELLTWQTQALQERAISRSAGRVDVRPELVVEIALDGLQASRRYPAGVALRFARVLRYRPDKSADQADTVQSLLDLHAAAAG